MKSSRAVLSALVGVALVAGSPGLALAAPPPVVQATAGTDEIVVEALSNRADLVSGGDVLLAVTLPDGADVGDLVVDVDGRDVTDAFRADGGRLVGLVEGLANADNTVTARLGRDAGSRLVVTNHPVEGPVFSGPHLQPWLCTTEDNGLGAPVDAGCNAPTVTSFFYKSTEGGALQAYDPAAPADDVATIEVDGASVPYIVQRERGTMNRGIYDVAGLWDPAAADGAEATWNGKLLYAFGASSGTVHSQGPPSAVSNVLVDHALSRGYMVATNSLNTRGHSQNPVVSAESVMMLKEHITETYGEIRFTMGQGGSGGAIGQQMVANNYPGLLDGIQPSASFPDGTTTGMEVVDCVVLNRYYAQNAEQWPQQARAAVNGNQLAAPGTCNAWQFSFAALLNPVGGCGPAVDGTDQAYHPETNPDGVRCTAQDYEKNIWGLDENGIANSPISNVGVQYGLGALRSGAITPEQFVDLNAEVGGLDKDSGSTAQRMAADPFAVETAYRAGQVNDFSQADKVAIIDLRTPENNSIHTDYHSDEVRARLIQANGHAENQVIWRLTANSAPTVGLQSFLTMDGWLTAIENDTRSVSLERKVRDNKPGAAVDACFIDGTKSTDAAQCAERFPVFAFPRIVAGGPATHDNVDCQLGALDRASYGDVVFTDEQWNRLVETFSGTGVCDYSQTSQHVQPSVPWLSFADGPGGEPLGDPPVATTAAALPGQQPTQRFSDLPTSSIYFEDVEFLAEAGITLGFPDGTYRPAGDVSRGQMAAFLYRGSGERFTAPATATFVDVPTTSIYFEAVEWLAAEKITVGSPAPGGGTAFRPDEGVARGQMSAFLYRYAGEPAFALPASPSFSDVPASYVFYDDVEWLAANDISVGFADGTYKPLVVVTRGQMAAFLNRFAVAVTPAR